MLVGDKPCCPPSFQRRDPGDDLWEARPWRHLPRPVRRPSTPGTDDPARSLPGAYKARYRNAQFQS